MNHLKELLDLVLRVVFGHRVADEAKDWKDAHNKAKGSRAELEQIIKESEQPQ